MSAIKTNSILSKIEAIDKEIAALAAERAELSAKFQATGKTRYFNGTPKKPGIYHYSSASCATIGGAYGEWTGERWRKWGDWGDFTNRGSAVVWLGEGRGRRQPLTPERVRELTR